VRDIKAGAQHLLVSAMICAIAARNC
jgi:hypothetical protein